MKLKMIVTIGALALLGAVTNINAQSTPPSSSGSAWDFFNNTPMTNVSVAAYGTFMPTQHGQEAQAGGGALLLYDLLPGSAVEMKSGIGIDYLGALQIVSANVSFQLPTHPLARWIHSDWGQRFTATPFTITALGVTWGANNDTAPTSAIGAGLSTTVVGRWSVFGAWVNRQNASGASGNSYNFGISHPLGWLHK
jgi:hypothetical protein